MTLLFNLSGAIQSLETAQSTSEIIRRLNRVVEEFYRSIAVLFHTRYVALETENIKPFSANLVSLIENHFDSPSFESWLNLGRICGDLLQDLGDPIASSYTELAHKKAEPEIRDRIDALSKIVGIEEGKTDGDYPRILKVLRKFRELSNARMFYEPTLRSLIDAGLKEIIPVVITDMLECFRVRVIIPLGFRKDETRSIEVKSGIELNLSIPAQSNYEKYLLECYLWFEGEDPFKYRTALLYYVKTTKSAHVYNGFMNNIASYEAINLEGISLQSQKDFATIYDVFDIPPEGVGEADSMQRQALRFGRNRIVGGTINNLRERMIGYVERPKASEELVKKLNHRRSYIITLDGGGGFGKTELAVSTVWNLIEKPEQVEGNHLTFDRVIWVPGKLEYFHVDHIRTTHRAIRTLNDLMDCILYVTNNVNAIKSPSEVKRSLVTQALNGSESTLIILDNLETVSEKDIVWEFLIELGNLVTSDLKVIVTSRVRVGTAEFVVRVRAMEYDEARALALLEMENRGIPDTWTQEPSLSRIVEASGRIPLLIRYFVILISKGHSFDEIVDDLPEDTGMALDFMCGMQWKELSVPAKKLLTGIAYWRGTLTFSEAKLLCGMSYTEFVEAKQELVHCSFLVDQRLIESVLELLPPITSFAQSKLNEYPSFRKEYIDNESLLRTPETTSTRKKEQSFTDEIALNQMFQRANLLSQQGEIDLAHSWYQKAMEKFPQNSLAWLTLAEFEYRYLEDISKANESMRRASLLDPTNSFIFETWAYWEYSRGTQDSLEASLAKAIRLYGQALELTVIESDKRRIKSMIATANMEIGLIIRNRIVQEPSQNTRDLDEKKDLHIIKAIDLLEDNLYEIPRSDEEIMHNALIHEAFARAYLYVKPPWFNNRDTLDKCAIHHMIEALKLKAGNRRIRHCLRNHLLLKALAKNGKNVSPRDNNKKLIASILELESKVEKSCLKISNILRLGGG